MEKHLRNAPTYAVAVALIIQITRVADFGERIGAGWLAWVYAAFLALTIYALSYWHGRLDYKVTATPDDRRAYAQQVRMEKLHRRARISTRLWLALFLVVDGSLNFAETMAALPSDVSIWEFGGAAVYGVFPTLAAFGLGSLQAHIDRIPAGASKASVLSKVADKLLASWMASDKQGSANPQAVAQEDLQGDKQGEQVAPLLVQPRKQALQDSELLAYLAGNPQASDQQVADKFGVSRQAIQQRRRKLIERGAFMQTPVVEQEKVKR